MQNSRTENRIRKAIAEKGTAIGTFLGISTPSIVETVSNSGLGYVNAQGAGRNVGALLFLLV